MLKTLIISVNLIGLMLLNAFASKEVKITHDTPVFATLGEEYIVTVTIDKAKVEGFAKYQINVPTGLTVEPIETLGASFTFRNGEAKFIWMSLPDESTFDITYTLKVESSAKVGNNDLVQWFSYLDKNERMTAEPPLHVIEIASDDVSNTGIAEGAVHGTRRITKLNPDHYLIEIDLYKNDIKGFAKLQETLPKGTSAEAVKKANGVFTQLDDKVKVVWFGIPEEENMSIVYEVLSTKGGIGDEPFSGEFTYLKNNETKTVEIIQGEIREGADVADAIEDARSDATVEEESEEKEVEDVADDTNATLTDVETEVVDKIIEEYQENETEDASEKIELPEVTETGTGQDTMITITDPIKEVEVVEEEDTEEESTAEVSVEEATPTDTIEEVVVDSFSDITYTPTPDQGVTYRVQIMAGHNVVDNTFVAKKYKFTRPFDIENHEGWVKYTTGSHSLYKAARDSRIKISDNYNFDGPFVTAYNDGVRITVQEALMISRQKWYQ